MPKPTLEMQVVNLRLQLDALQKATQEASLPEAVTKMRNTVKWSAMGIAIALIVSSLVRMFEASEIKSLEKRIERLEQYRAEKPLLTP